jgi:hypothetical protein
MDLKRIAKHRLGYLFMKETDLIFDKFHYIETVYFKQK